MYLSSTAWFLDASSDHLFIPWLLYHTQTSFSWSIHRMFLTMLTCPSASQFYSIAKLNTSKSIWSIISYSILLINTIYAILWKYKWPISCSKLLKNPSLCGSHDKLGMHLFSSSSMGIFACKLGWLPRKKVFYKWLKYWGQVYNCTWLLQLLNLPGQHSYFVILVLPACHLLRPFTTINYVLFTWQWTLCFMNTENTLKLITITFKSV